MKLPASYHQERLWFIDRFEAGNLYEASPVYHNIPLLLKIKGAVDLPLLEKSIRYVANRHEALRTLVITVDNKPVQRIEPEADIKLEFLDLSEAEGNGPDEEQGLKPAIADSRRPFSLDKGPLFRATLIRLKEQSHILVITVHHIVSDKYSLEVIARDVFSAYRAGLEGKNPGLAELPIHYADFSQAQLGMPPQQLKPLIRYWKTQLRGKIQALELPTDHTRAVVHRFREGRQSFDFPGDLNRKIREYAAGENTDVFIFLLAALKVLFYKYSGLEEIVVGTSAEDRSQPELAGVVGPIANLLVLRTKLSGDWSFVKLVRDLQRTVRDAYRYRAMPFDKLVSELNPGKDMSRTALFDVLFRYEENPLQVDNVAGLEIDAVETNLGWGKYDLNLLVQNREDGFSGVLVYNSDYYENHPEMAY